jgi:GWxTD domain-containing protein
MRRLKLSWLLFVTGLAGAQSLQEINLRHLYDLSLPFRFEMRLARGATDYWVFYTLRGDSVDRYSVRFSRRVSFQSSESRPVDVQPVVLHKNSNVVIARIQTSVPVSPEVLVATVSNEVNKVEYNFPRFIDANHPATGILLTQDENAVVFNAFTATDSQLKPIFDEGSVLAKRYVFYYDTPFPPASPPMSTTGQVAAYFEADTVVLLDRGALVHPQAAGLYLIQEDTTRNEGIAFRAQTDYPRYTRLANLVAPMSYITTREEYATISASTGDKKTFDQSILAITETQERARTLIRNYFRRIEQANILFTSYKEGWKTDRGMIYTIYGLPDEVKLTGERERWKYVNRYGKAEFEFFRAGSIFDPENYVLQRDKKHEESWYMYIDLWRKARF